MKRIQGLFLGLFSLALATTVCTQNNYPELSRFDSGARHWYGIFDEVRMIEPLPDQKQYNRRQITQIADNILLFQKDNGGWPKNYDMKAILTEDQKSVVKAHKQELNTTFDNGATHSQMTYLAEVYTITGTERYKSAFLKGLDYIFQAQYDNGGWPQFYPDTSGYRQYITFNDDAMIGILDMFQNIIQGSPEYAFVDDSLRMKIHHAYRKGIDCVLRCQIVENGVKTAWCQQHDQLDSSPRDARTFEKASICNQESAALTMLLMNDQHPDSAMIDAVESSIRWYRNSEIHGIRVKWIQADEEQFIYHRSNMDRMVVEDPDAPRIWARFYELETHVPIFCGRDGVVKYAMADIDRDRRTGYGWYVYTPEEAYHQYDIWRKQWTPDRNLLAD